jgi:NADPH:quinone reductase
MSSDSGPPAIMRALEIQSYDGRPESLAVVERPVPRPRRGEVLVRIAAAPVNPSDLMFLRGLYGYTKPLPAVPGFEGSGEVVESGGGWKARLLVGRRVACAAADPKVEGGTWAQYLATSADFCVPLRREVTLEQGAMMLVNPLTAWALVEMARAGRHRAVVQTAAASALGRMILRLGERFQLPVIHVVRREEQVELLRKMGATLVLNSAAEGFNRDLRSLCARAHATLALDAVAGEMTGRVLEAMPKGSRAIVYGGLALAACQVNPASLIFGGQKVEGFWLSEWLRNKSFLERFRVASRVQKMLAGEMKSEIRGRFSLEDAPRALADYAANMTAGKVLFTP